VKKWLLLVYRIPRVPTAGRVFVWRKLKQLGAIDLPDAVYDALFARHAQKCGAGK